MHLLKAGGSELVKITDNDGKLARDLAFDNYHNGIASLLRVVVEELKGETREYFSNGYLLHAAASGYALWTHDLLRLGVCDVSENVNGHNALYVAVKRGSKNYRTVLTLLQYYNIDRTLDGDYDKALQLASDFKYEDIERLLTFYQNADAETRKYFSARLFFHAAAQAKDSQVLQDLLHHFLYYTWEPDWEGRTALHIAAASGCKECTDLLMDTDWLFQRDNNGQTPADYMSNAEIKRHLIRRSVQALKKLGEPIKRRPNTVAEALPGRFRQRPEVFKRTRLPCCSSINRNAGLGRPFALPRLAI
jgi:hypothetical protein